MNQHLQQVQAWHALDLPSLEKSLDARPGGLTDGEAAERLRKFGPNELPHQVTVTFLGAAAV